MKRSETSQSDPPLLSYMPPLLAAIALMAALCLAVGGWAMLAKIDAAIVSTGVLHADSDRKTVEHLEGGILAEFLVRPGDSVAAGQVVARLDSTQIREQLVQLTDERNSQLFTLWRLAAEQDNKAPDPQTAPGPEVGLPPKDRSRLIASAVDLAQARAQAHAAQVSSLERQIGKLRSEIKGHDAQSRAASAQLALRKEERKMVDDLVSRGASPRARLWELERAIASLTGQRDEELGLAQAAVEEIARAEAEIAAVVQTRQVEISAQLTETRSALATVESQIRAARDVLDRHKLRAPQDGTVVDLYTVTPGAVLPSGEALMTILPADDQLVALLRLPPSSIDSVAVGRPADVRLSAYKRVDAPTLAGTVAFVSADILEDPVSNEGYFEVRIALAPEEVEALTDAEVIAGMPVDVTITIGSRRAGEYLLEPILRHMRLALREE